MYDGTLTRWGQTSGGEGMNGVVAVSAGAIHTLVIRTNLDSPVIRRQPPDMIVPLGISTSLVVIASSSLPFQFQWQRQVEGIWQDLPGATTHALPFPNLQDSNNGQYRVRVTTAAG